MKDISFTIEPGELVGYIGANGAGKSTTISPTSGEVLVNGIVPQKERIKNNYQIGTVFGQRTQLFLHDPSVVYLDEPTIGLDIMVKEKIREFIKHINREKNTTVILTTHDMQDIEAICKKVIIIDEGSIIYNGSLDEINHQFGNERTIQFQLESSDDELQKVLDACDGVSVVASEHNSITVKFDGRRHSVGTILKTISPYCVINDMSISEAGIESIVKGLYRKAH